MLYKNILKPTSLIFALLSSSVSVVNASDSFIEHGRVTRPTIKVLSNGESYTDAIISNPSIKVVIPTYYELDAGRDRVILNLDISTSIRRGIGSPRIVSYPSNSLYKYISLPPNQQTRRFERTLHQHVSANPLREHAQDQCNEVATSLRRQGKTNREIFSQNRAAHFNVKTTANYMVSGGGSTPVLTTDISKVTVMCARDTGVPNRRGGLDIPSVSHITLKANKSTGKTCKLSLSGSMLTSHANVLFQYQLIFNGRVQPRKYSTTSRSNKKAKIRHQFTVLNHVDVFNATNGTLPKTGRFQVLADGLRSTVAAYSINCFLPRIKPSTPNKIPGLQPKLNSTLLQK